MSTPAFHPTPSLLRLLRLLPLGLAALAAAPMARAGDQVYWSIGVTPAPGVYLGASNAPAPMVMPVPVLPVQVRPVPQPVYVRPAPQPVYVRPAPQPVYVQPPVYLLHPSPAFVPPGHQRHGHRHWHRGHGHGHGHGRADR